MTQAEREAVSEAVSALDAVHAIVDALVELPNGGAKEAGLIGVAMLARAASVALSEVIR